MESESKVLNISEGVTVRVNFKPIVNNDLRGIIEFEFEGGILDGLTLTGTRTWLGGKITVPCFKFLNKETNRTEYNHFLKATDEVNKSALHNFKRALALAIEATK